MVAASGGAFREQDGSAAEAWPFGQQQPRFFLNASETASGKLRPKRFKALERRGQGHVLHSDGRLLTIV